MSVASGSTIVRHYQGEYYRIIADANHTETGAPLVIYQNDKYETFACPSEVFYSCVEVNGEILPKFSTVAIFPGVTI